MKPLMILIALLCVGCGPRHDYNEPKYVESGLIRTKSGQCEYIIYSHPVLKEFGIVHAGDCPNPKHGEGR